MDGWIDKERGRGTGLRAWIGGVGLESQGDASFVGE